MKSRFGAVATLCAVLLAVGGGLANAKSPLRWKLGIDLDFSARNPAGRLETSTAKGNQVYWYVVYTVKNTHDEAVPLNLVAKAITDVNPAGVTEGYYPRAILELKKKYGEDLQDTVSITGRELRPGESMKVAAVFQFKKKDGSFDERQDVITMKIAGFCDPVKKDGRTTTTEERECWMKFKRPGDEHQPWRESLQFVSTEEQVVTG